MLFALAPLVALGMSAAVLVVGLRLSAPRPAAAGAPPANLALAEVVEIPSASGALLRAWWVPAERSGAGAVVLLHGVWENRRRMLRRAEVLHAGGYAVLLPDLQAHGESTGRRITFGGLEGRDAAAAVGFVRVRLPDERIGLIGVSLGGAAAVLAPDQLGVDALILESVYPDINAALLNRLAAGLGPTAGAVFAPVLAPLFRWLLPPVLGVTAAELRPVDRIASVGVPVLVMSGDLDDRTTPAEGRALFDRAAEPKRFVLMPGAAHVDLEAYDPQAYWAEVLGFLGQYIRLPGTRLPPPPVPG